MRYEIKGDTLPAVILYPDSGETIVTENGGMAWMSPNMRMETSGGGLGRMFGRAISGESIFINRYTAEGGPGLLACASSFPGSIKAMEIAPSHSIILQKKAFLCSVGDVRMEVFFHKRLSAGLFGGEGFIMQRIAGSGTVFAEFDGSTVEYDLQPGQQIIADTGSLAAMTDTCRMDIQTVRGLKNVFFGGEGIFNTVITGPGHVWLQTMPAIRMAQALLPYLPQPNSSN